MSTQALPLSQEIERRKQRDATPRPPREPQPAIETVQTATRPASCTVCQEEFEATVLMDGELEICSMRFCPTCLQRRSIDTAEQRWDAHHREIDDRATKSWPSICPPLYQKSSLDQLRDIARLRPIINKVLATEYSAKGLGLSGPTRLGKTRLMFLLLRKLHFQGHWVKYINAATFSDTLSALWSDSAITANGWVKSFCACPSLFLDDLGKGRMTERAQSTLWRIVEHRTAWELPIYVTANASGQQLIEKMNQEKDGDSDAAEPIVERLREFVDFIDL